MKYLALALLIYGLVSLSNAQCFVKPVTSDKMTHCQDHVDGTWHEVGSTWRNSACQKCSCSSCCYAYSTPKSFPDDCVSVFDQKACTYIVHKRDNPAEHCPIFVAVGK
ncbi:beta-microseminoprotein-like [Melanotaenia boesemani]|uniref:beta-microseminoprotein-like n=1 Tax=Melanotaenia boesemani TaxID=1250792 RepID=UPI001C05C16E|nr:beta-microseminoprotein-like [Melanotaenia boesemani]